MKTYLDCIPCFFRQGLEAARIATANEEKQREVLDEIAKELGCKAGDIVLKG